jgi:NAD(P)-dependent dehydrogenase (short-subunit alcohol dehydrogenase family)
VVAFDRQCPDQSQQNTAIEFILGDVTNVDNVQRIADDNEDVQHVVFSVGIGSGVAGFPFWNLSPSDWARVVEVNLLGAVNVAHAFAPKLAERQRGTFLFLASVAGQIGSQTDPPYSAAKAALINFMQCAARDLAPYGVRVNAISPGMVQTDLNESVWKASQASLPETERCSYNEWADAKLRRVAPLGRWQSAEECAAMATYLASDHAKNITGQTINIDGGQVMHS